jgi:hypothetical protein
MRKLSAIWSERSFAKYMSIGIVNEWEDELSRSLCLPIKTPGYFNYAFYHRLEKYGLVDLYHFLTVKSSVGLRFIMTAYTAERCYNNINTIPVIIDFWLDKDAVGSFSEAFRRAPLVLITSLEVYDFLKQNDCPLPIEHWPLSIPDKYLGLPENRNKKYDFCVFGRPNPFFLRFLEQYSDSHPEFVYVMNKGDIGNRSYVTNKGVFVGRDTGRESYLNMISETRVTCYTTPGLDEGKKESSDFNQVTPRLFEMLSRGCHVIGHYPKNADTEWYDLASIVPNVDSYEEFEACLDHYLSVPFDTVKAQAFLTKHCTSARAKSLADIVRKYGIEI